MEAHAVETGPSATTTTTILTTSASSPELSTKGTILQHAEDHRSSVDEDTVGDIVVSPVVVSPPYWVQRHARSTSTQSYSSLLRLRPQISLEDHTDDIHSDSNKGLWARSVTIPDYLVISGNVTGYGAYVVYNCHVQTLSGGVMKISRRYSEFDELRANLVRTFPLSTGSLPNLPPKSVISRFRSQFLEKRRLGLAYFLNCVLLNPEFAASPIVKEFLFPQSSGLSP